MDAARPLAWRGAAIPCHRPHGFPHRRGPVRYAGDPAVADAALRRDAGRDGFAVNAAPSAWRSRASGRLSSAAHRSPARHSGEPGAAGCSHHAARQRTRPGGVHDPADHARPLHGVRLCLDAGLSGRAMQLDRRRRGLCGLYCRQCRQQSDRAAGVGSLVDSSDWPPISTSSRCSISPARCWSTSPFEASSRCTPCRYADRHWRP